MRRKGIFITVLVFVFTFPMLVWAADTPIDGAARHGISGSDQELNWFARVLKKWNEPDPAWEEFIKFYEENKEIFENND